MLPWLSNNKGFTLIDALLAVAITTVGVLALFSLIPQGWMLARYSDERGRAAMIMQAEFENAESLVSNKCNATPVGPYVKTVYSSGRAAPLAEGDQAFQVTKTFVISGFMVTGGKTPTTDIIWTVTVAVVEVNSGVTMSESRQVVQKDDYSFPVVDVNAVPRVCSAIFSVSYN